MIGADFSSVYETFANRFEFDGHDYLFRSGAREAPVRVSPAERDAFVLDFKRRFRLIVLAPAVTMPLLVATGLWLFPNIDQARLDTLLYGGVAAVVAMFLLTYRWAWTAPARALERRAPAGSARTREEATAHHLDNLSYGQLALVIPAAVLLVWNVSDDQDVLSGWGRLWLLFGLALIALAGVQALRKWRHDRRRRDSGAAW